MIVAISGLSGSGKSSVAKILSGIFGWPHVAAGIHFRNIARKTGCDIYELSKEALINKDIDLEVTKIILDEVGKYENCILDAHGAALITKDLSRLCFFLIVLYWSEQRELQFVMASIQML